MDKRDKDESDAGTTVVPIPAVDTVSEHQRVRSSNDRDQRLERDGKGAPHNQGYDEVADLTPVTSVEPVDD